MSKPVIERYIFYRVSMLEALVNSLPVVAAVKMECRPVPGQEILVVPVRPGASRPSPGEPVRLRSDTPQCAATSAAIRCKSPGLQIAAPLKLAEVLKPDTFSASGITHRT